MALLEMGGAKRQGRAGRDREWIRAEREAAMAGLDASAFALPSTHNPRNFVSSHFGPGSGMEFVKGTTTLAFIYEPATPADKGGIIVAVDSRASTGTYTASKTVTKILDISPQMVATMAGGAADCQYWIRYLAKETALYEIQNGRPMTVAAASKHLSNVMYYFKDQGLSMGSMVAGYDKRGPAIYFVDQDGVRLGGKLFSVGSGCLNAVSVLDTHHKEKMTDAEARELGTRAICHATYRDAGSGGFVNLCHISGEGKEFVWRRDVSELYHLMEAEKGIKPLPPVIH